jgi:hypothetical protein
MRMPQQLAWGVSGRRQQAVRVRPQTRARDARGRENMHYDKLFCGNYVLLLNCKLRTL